MPVEGIDYYLRVSQGGVTFGNSLLFRVPPFLINLLWDRTVGRVTFVCPFLVSDREGGIISEVTGTV